MTRLQARIDYLQAQGFAPIIIRGGMLRVKCDQCAAAVINGVPAHESGCPNAVHECKGCNALIPMRQTWCEDCR